MGRGRDCAGSSGPVSFDRAPLVVGDLVITGVSGGDAPLQGFIAAFQASTGQDRVGGPAGRAARVELLGRAFDRRRPGFLRGDRSSFAAVDAASGSALWHFNTGQEWRASPMTYLVNGRQHVAIAAGGNILSFALRER